VTKRSIAAGMVVTPGVPVFTVLSPAPVWANVGVAESDAQRIRPGMTADVVMPATGTVVTGGVVESILPQADPLSRSFTAKIRLSNSDRLLRPGNVVVVHVQTGQSRPVVLVPPQVVFKHPDGSLYVWVVDKVRHTALRQVVEAGALRGTEVEILSGLKPGDQVLLNVPLTLFEGTSLKVSLSK
jgi:RND family efflux transporter MFP subunit